MSYYSAFISFGGGDRAFAEFLNEELRIRGVDTFLFTKDAVPGEKLHAVMWNGINKCDRMILLCSEDSLNRPGVLNEIEKGLEREAREGGRSIIIPVTLDDYVFKWNPERRPLAQVKDKVYADFRCKDRETTQAGIERLVFALRKGEKEYDELSKMIRNAVSNAIQLTPSALRGTIDLLLQSLTQRESAQVHAELALAYVNLSNHFHCACDPRVYLPLAAKEAGQALALDPLLPAGHAVRGLLYSIYDNDFGTARAFFEESLRLSRGRDPKTHLYYAYQLLGEGKPLEAIRYADLAAEYGHDVPIILGAQGKIHLLAGDLSGAIAAGKRATKQFSGHWGVGELLGLSYEQAGKHDEAIEHLSVAVEQHPGPGPLANLAHAFATMGKKDEAENIFERYRELVRAKRIAFSSGYCEALFHVALGQTDEAVEALEIAHEQRCGWLLHLLVEPRWRPLSNSTRFQLLAARMGLNAPSRSAASH